jgi:hypothetical protein
LLWNQDGQTVYETKRNYEYVILYLLIDMLLRYWYRLLSICWAMELNRLYLFHYFHSLGKHCNILFIALTLYTCIYIYLPICLFIRYYYHRQSVTVTLPLLRIIHVSFRPFISSAVLCWSVIHLYLFVGPGLQLMWIDSSTCLVRRKLSRFVLLILLLLLLLLFLS